MNRFPPSLQQASTGSAPPSQPGSPTAPSPFSVAANRPAPAPGSGPLRLTVTVENSANAAGPIGDRCFVKISGPVAYFAPDKARKGYSVWRGPQSGWEPPSDCWAHATSPCGGQACSRLVPAPAVSVPLNRHWFPLQVNAALGILPWKLARSIVTTSRGEASSLSELQRVHGRGRTHNDTHELREAIENNLRQVRRYGQSSTLHALDRCTRLLRLARLYRFRNSFALWRHRLGWSSTSRPPRRFLRSRLFEGVAA